MGKIVQVKKNNSNAYPVTVTDAVVYYGSTSKESLTNIINKTVYAETFYDNYPDIDFNNLYTMIQEQLSEA